MNIGQVQQDFQKLSDRLPCLTAFAGVICGGPGYFLMLEVPLPSRILFPAFFCLIIGWTLLGTRRCAIRFALPLLAALLSSLWTLHTLRQAFAPESFHWHGPTGLQMLVRLEDRRLTGNKPSWLQSLPSSVMARCMRFRYSEFDEWHPADAPLFLQLKKNSAPLEYGDVLLASGCLEPIAAPRFRGAFHYKDHALARGIRYRFSVSDFVLRQPQDSMIRRLNRWRSDILDSLTSRMRSPDAKALAAGMLFGIRQGISPEISGNFRNSGTIHLLSVSGLHIGLFCSILILLFRLLPFRLRLLGSLLPVLLYVIATGMQSPAERAFLMFGIWCIFYAFCMRTPVLNTILFAAVFMLIMNPLLILDLGFQYSFLCVFFLLAGFRLMKDFREALTARWKFLPGERKAHPVRAAYTHLLLTAASSVTAWLSGAAVSLGAQGLFAVGSVPAYLLMMFPAWLCFFLFAAALIFWFIPPVSAFAGMIMEPVLDFILLTAKGFSFEYRYTCPVSGWVTVAFLFLLLLILLIPDKKRAAFLGGLLSFAVCTVLFFVPLFLPDEFAVIADGGAAPCIIFASPSTNRAWVTDVPDRGIAASAVDYLRSRGISRVEELHFSGNSRAHCGGGVSFLCRLCPGAVSFCKPPAKNAAAAREISDVFLRLGRPRVPYGSGMIRSETKKAETRVFLKDYVITVSPNRTVLLQKGGKELLHWRIPSSPDHAMKVLPLK